MSFVAKKDTSAYVNLMFYSFILRNILSTMCTVADIRWLCYTFNILLPRIQAIYWGKKGTIHGGKSDSDAEQAKGLRNNCRVGGKWSRVSLCGEASPESGGPYLPSYFSEGNTGPDTAEGLREHCPYIPFGYPGRSGWTEWRHHFHGVCSGTPPVPDARCDSECLNPVQPGKATDQCHPTRPSKLRDSPGYQSLQHPHYRLVWAEADWFRNRKNPRDVPGRNHISVCYPELFRAGSNRPQWKCNRAQRYLFAGCCHLFSFHRWSPSDGYWNAHGYPIRWRHRCKVKGSPFEDVCPCPGGPIWKHWWLRTGPGSALPAVLRQRRAVLFRRPHQCARRSEKT